MYYNKYATYRMTGLVVVVDLVCTNHNWLFTWRANSIKFSHVTCVATVVNLRTGWASVGGYFETLPSGGQKAYYPYGVKFVTRFSGTIGDPSLPRILAFLVTFGVLFSVATTVASGIAGVNLACRT